MSQPANNAPYRRAWRIEHRETCDGPWGEHYPWLSLVPADRPDRMPTPGNDRLHRPKGGWRDYYNARGMSGRFAFPSLTVLRRWVNQRACEAAHEAGYVCRVYAVDFKRHILFENQIIFDARGARVLRELTLLEVPVELEACQLRQMASCI